MEAEDDEVPDDVQINEMMAIHESDMEIYREIDEKREQVHFLLIYICNFHVLSHLLLIYICKLHWNCRTA